MKEYGGVIRVGEISSRPIQTAGSAADAKDFIPMQENNIRFVHYPGCQQLIIWLTHPGREYGAMRLINAFNDNIMQEWPVPDLLSGSIQLLWDTLSVAPGQYRVEIDWHYGWQHLLYFEKLEEGLAIPSEPERNELPEKAEGRIQYKDGFGNSIVEEDLVLRAKVEKEIIGKCTRHLEYEGTFRAGTIIYIENDIRIEFSHEMGGGNCMFVVDIPTEQQWELQTKIPLSARQDIIEFLAKRILAEQAPQCNYVIKANSIAYYYQ